MEYVCEEHLKLLLSKEWLVKIDSEKSVSYLLKFYASAVDMSCCILITDTRNVWGEALTSKQIARRWRDCNPKHSPEFPNIEEEDKWRTAILEVLSASHTLGAIMDLNFGIVDSHYADFSFELGNDEFRWRWDTYPLGAKAAADVLSRQLIMPLISVTHLAFSSADPVSELSEADLEKAVDKVGRTARRTVDTHVKHTVSRPRVATTLRRMTAVFNYLPDPPSISLDVVKPDLSLPTIQLKSRASTKSPRSSDLQTSVLAVNKGPAVDSMETVGSQPTPEIIPSEAISSRPADEDSVTEDEDEDRPAVLAAKGQIEDVVGGPSRSAVTSPSGSPTRAVSSQRLRQSGPGRARTPEQTSSQGVPSIDSPSSPPAKRTKRTVESSSSSGDEDSEAERRRHVARIKSTSTRGAKQPLKRGGRRF